MAQKPNVMLFSIEPERLESIIRETVRTEIQNLIPKEEEKDLISSKELVEWLGIHPSTLSNWKKNDVIPFKKIGDRVYFSRKEVLEAMKESDYERFHQLRKIN